MGVEKDMCMCVCTECAHVHVYVCGGASSVPFIHNCILTLLF